jgi:UDP-GlcNAc3NAcA epimerase
MKILTVIGARPQFIKAAAFSHALKSNDLIEEVIVHTGQHYDKNMSEVFFNQLQIPMPNYRLESGGKTHGAMTAYQLAEIEKILLKETPNCLVLFGDTNSTLSGALAASKLRIPIVHIEAGLRSFNNKMPEEINRIITDRLSQFLFCPSQDAQENLINEGYQNFDIEIHIVGDIMLDAIKLFIENLEIKTPYNHPFIVCTIHRQENTDESHRLIQIIEGLNEIAKTIKIIFPIHPRTQKKIDDLQIVLNNNLILTEPKSYIDFLTHVKYSELVITDSGGLQKESYFMKKNCLVIREETEWNELISHNFNTLCGFKKENIIKNFQNRSMMNNNFELSLYGDGTAANQIIKIISDKL